MYRCHTTVLLTGLSSLTLSCQPGDAPAGEPGTEVRDSAGGGNGIRSHGFIRVQGVPQRTITPPLIVS